LSIIYSCASLLYVYVMTVGIYLLAHKALCV